MLKLFRNSSPYAVLALFVAAICLKLNYLVYPSEILLFKDQPVWEKFISPFGKAAFGFTFLGIVNIVLQALFLNKIARDFSLFPRDSYLPALSFVLVSSIFPDWNYLSAFQVANLFILAALYNLLKLYAYNQPNKLLFNIGCCISLASILVFPNILLIILFFIALSILRPFKLKEWMIGILGLLTPFYFLASFLFLTDNMLLLKELFPFSFTYPQIGSPATYIPLIFIALILMVGFYYLNVFSGRMLMQIKKSWGIILTSLIITLIIGFFSPYSGFYGWLPALLPFSLTFANLWFEDRKLWFTRTVFYLFIVVIVFVQWFPIT